MRYKIYNIIGEVKSGTTLVGTLLDSHSDITTIPIELKLISHFINKKDLNDKNLLKYYLNRTRLKHLEFNKKNIMKREFRVINGIYKINEFNFEKFQKLVLGEKIVKYSKKRIINIIIHIHKHFELSQNKILKKNIIIQDGNHILHNFDFIQKKFPEIKNILVFRNPLDIYTSLKKITEITKDFYFTINSFGSEKGNIVKVTNLINKDRKDIFYIKYEDLVESPKKMMFNLSRFLNIKFSKSLLKPTFINSDWYGNSSSERKIYGIKNTRINLYKKKLKNSEIRYLSYKFKEILERKYNFQKIKNYNLLTILLVYLNNFYLFSKNCDKDYKYPIRLVKFLYKLVFNYKDK